MKLALLYFGIKAKFVKVFEYLFNMLVVCRHIIRVNEYIIKIDHNTKIQKIREYVIYKSLKDYESINKAEWYYRPLK